MTDGVTIAKGPTPMKGATLRVPLLGVDCKLVPLGPEHTDRVIRWRNDPDIARYFLTAHRFEQAGHEAWLARTLAGDQDFNWAIEDECGVPVGTVGLYNVVWSEGRAEFGRLLIGERDARGKGLARKATELVVRAAAEAHLSDIYLDVKSSNVAALSLYLTAGFGVIGELDGTIRMRANLCATGE
jgi:RimJ/RimL family protein N-acetyltransferase